MSREYVAFISYRHTRLSMKVAKKLHSVIEQYRVPKALRKGSKKRLGLVFRDQEELPVSSNLSEDICNALDHSEFLIVVCTPDTPGSVWVSREIEYFLSKHPRGNVLAVLAEGEPLESFPEQLRVEVDPETGERKDVEPLAADVRGKSDREVVKNISKEAPRLFAAVLGCPYDALVMREQKRKRKKILWISALILAVVSAFAIFAASNNIILSKKNEELERQKQELKEKQQEILLRESEMLTKNAEESLEEEEYLEATRYAVSALPQSDDRPYYAPAEKALIEAMDILDKRNDDFWMIDTVLTQETAVCAYAVSDDGSRLVTVDAYGTVNMFDTVSGDTLWTKQTDCSYSAKNAPVFVDGSKTFILNSIYNISAYDASSGKELWTYSELYGINDCGIILSPDKASLAFVNERTYPEDSFSRYDYFLTVLSIENGEVINEYSLIENVGMMDVKMPNAYDNDFAWGCFDESGRFFAGAYLISDEEFYSECVYYFADLESGEVKKLYITPKSEDTLGDPPHTPLAMALDSKEMILKLAVVSDKDTVPAMFIAVNVASGEILWKTEAPEEQEGTTYSSSDERKALFTNGALVYSLEKKIYIFNFFTGEFQVSGEADSKVIALYPQLNDDAFFFSFVTEAGSYCYAWSNGKSVISSYAMGNDIALNSNLKTSVLACGGCFEPIVTDGKVEGQLIGNENEGLGYIAVITEEDSHSVKVYRATPIVKDEKPEIKFLEEGEFISGMMIPCGEDLYAIGPITNYSAEDYIKNYIIINTETKEKVGEIPLHEITTLFDDVYLLPDMKGYIDADSPSLDENGQSYNNILFYDAEKGEAKMLLENERIELGILADTQMVTSKYDISAAVQTDSFDVISVAADGDVLRIWKNETEQTSVNIKESGVNWYYETTGNRDRFIKAGSNGYIILSHYSEENKERKISDFAVYSIEDNCFTFIPDTQNGDSLRTIMIADSKPFFAVLDADSHIRIYDINKKGIALDIDLPISENAVKEFKFIVDDTMLLLLTRDSQVFIYDIATGEYLFREELPLLDVNAAFDENNGRLYLYSDSNAAVCINTTDWEIIAEIDDFVCYDSSRNYIYRRKYNEGLQMICIPSTEDLVKKALSLIGE